VVLSAAAGQQHANITPYSSVPMRKIINKARGTRSQPRKTSVNKEILRHDGVLDRIHDIIFALLQVSYVVILIAILGGQASQPSVLEKVHVPLSCFPRHAKKSLAIDLVS